MLINKECLYLYKQLGRKILNFEDVKANKTSKVNSRTVDTMQYVLLDLLGKTTPTAFLEGEKPPKCGVWLLDLTWRADAVCACEGDFSVRPRS